MPFALLIVGIVMVIASVRDTVQSKPGQEGLADLVKGDFTGQNNFVFWMVSILVIGALGYIPSMRGLSNVFLALVIVVLFLNKGSGVTGVFSQFNAALRQTESGAAAL